MNELRKELTSNINTKVLQVVAAILAVVVYIVQRRRSKAATALIELVSILLGGRGTHYYWRAN